MFNTNPALESIAFQKSDLFVAITNCLDKIRSMNFKVAEKIFYSSKEVQELQQVIESHTGIPFDFEDRQNGGFAVYLPRLSQTIFDNDVDLWIKQQYVKDYDKHYDMKRLLSLLSKDVVKGTVDLKRSRVTGDLCKLRCKMFLPRVYLQLKIFSNEELASFILHEIGHVFTTYEYLTRSSNTNQALSILLKTVDGSVSYSDKTIILAKCAEKLKLDKESQNLLEKETDPTKITSILISNTIQVARSELGASVFDINSCEYLADEFAARHGAGKYLITAMDKMGEYDTSMSTSEYLELNFGSMMSLAFLLITPLTMGAGAVGLMTGAGISGIISLIWTAIGLSSENTYRDTHDIYGNDFTRFSRVKHQMIQRLKDNTISKDERDVLLEHLDVVTPIIEKNLVHDKTKLRNKIAMFFSSTHKRDFEYMRLQKDLELLGNNDLYVMSQKLKTV